MYPIEKDKDLIEFARNLAYEHGVQKSEEYHNKLAEAREAKQLRHCLYNITDADRKSLTAQGITVRQKLDISPSIIPSPVLENALKHLRSSFQIQGTRIGRYDSAKEHVIYKQNETLIKDDPDYFKRMTQSFPPTQTEEEWVIAPQESVIRKPRKKRKIRTGAGFE